MPEHIIVKCHFCGGCSGACPENAITVLEDELLIDKKACKQCNICVMVCPSSAMVKK